jgi:hypothetical protein
MLDDIIQATDHAMHHYLTLTLSEDYLQNSSLGSPYRKWAIIFNENFERLDNLLKILFPVISNLHFESIDTSGHYDFPKSADVWLTTVSRKYACCEVNLDESILSLSAIGFTDSFDGREWLSQVRMSDPSIVTSYSVCIEDRAILTDIQNDGNMRVEMMQNSLDKLADWLLKNYTMTDVTTPRNTKWNKANTQN